MAHPLVPISGPDWFVQLAEAFTRTLKRRNRSPNTIRAYRSTFRRFGAHLDFCRVAEAEHLIPAVLHSWQDQLGEGTTPATRAQAASAMRSLLRWAAREESGVRPGLWDHIDPVAIPEQLPRPLWAADVNRILEHYAEACSAPSDDEVRYLELRRDRALFLFLLTASCRISEALSLRRDQIEIAGDRLVVRQKGGREHLLVPSATARAWLQDYMFARGRDKEPALWVWIGPRGLHRMNLRRANRIWAELCERLRLPRFTSHVLRHTGATFMARDGATDTEIARQLGHKTNQLVHRYRLVDEARRQVMANGLDRLVPASPVPELPAPDAPARRSRKRSRAEIMSGTRGGPRKGG